MKITLNPALAAIIRGILVAIGGALVAAGYLQSDESAALQDRLFEIIGGFFIVLPIAIAAWNQYREGHYKEALQTLLGVRPDKNIGPVTVGAAQTLKAQVDALTPPPTP